MEKNDLSNGTRNQISGTAEDDFDDSDDELSEVIVSEPSKASFVTDALYLSLQVGFVNFSGLHDKRSLQMLIPLIRPRKLILVGGGEEETASLARDCHSLLNKDGVESSDHAIEILTPSIGVAVDASVDTNSWMVKLTRDLYKQLQWQTVRGLSVVTLKGLLKPAPVESDPRDGSHKKAKIQKEQQTEKACMGLPPLDRRE